MIDDPQIRTLSVNGERRIAAFQLTRTVSTGVFVPPNAEVPAHYVLAGPVSGPPALMTPRLLVTGDVPFAAVLTEPNIFTELNIFRGIQLPTRVVAEDSSVGDNDFEILADASAGSITLSLPQNFGEGRFYHIKRTDATENIVTVAAFTGDNIDGSISVVLFGQYADCLLFGAASGYWDNMGASGAAGGDGGTIPETTNLLAGDGAGDAADSGIDPSRVVEIQSPLPARPTTLNEAIALLVSYGLCA